MLLKIPIMEYLLIILFIVILFKQVSESLAISWKKCIIMQSRDLSQRSLFACFLIFLAVETKVYSIHFGSCTESMVHKKNHNVIPLEGIVKNIIIDFRIRDNKLYITKCFAINICASWIHCKLD